LSRKICIQAVLPISFHILPVASAESIAILPQKLDYANILLKIPVLFTPSKQARLAYSARRQGFRNALLLPFTKNVYLCIWKKKYCLALAC
jgi:hypothetical protein